MRMLCGAVLFLGLFIFGLSSSADTPGSDYHLIKKIPIGGDGGWDYLNLDSAARRLYIARFDRVMVVDIDKETLIGEIPNTKGVHGVALVKERERGFSSNGGDSTVTVFDLQTLKEVSRIKVGQRPDAIVYDPATKRVFTMNAGSKDVSAIDAQTEQVVGTVALGGKPEFVVADEAGKIYVNLEDKNEIIAIDARELQVLNRWPLAPEKEPAGLAIDRKNRRLFSTCHSQKMVVLDADSGKVIATPAIGKGTDACLFDPDTRLAFSSNGDSTLTVVHEDDPDHFSVVANVKTEPGARTMALDSKTHNVYLVTAKSRPLSAEEKARRQRRAFESGSFVILVVGPK
jgi:YVTN family beta-propeller protein